MPAPDAHYLHGADSVPITFRRKEPHRLRRLSGSLLKHLPGGSLVANTLGHLRGRRPDGDVLWTGRSSSAAAIERMVSRAEQHLAARAGGSGLLSVGDSDDFHRQLNAALQKRNLPHRVLTLEELVQLPEHGAGQIAAILCGFEDAGRSTATLQALAGLPGFSVLPVEYAMGVAPEIARFDALDEYRDTYFVSPLLLSQPSPYDLYEESLRYCPQKCGLRDYLDLFQLLKAVVDGGIDGDIAEFGSYEGHSGWLIARSLQALGSDKRVYLFDTYDGFPHEDLGVDHFWNQSHPVQFETVQRRLKGFDSVHLVRGDFTQTLSRSGLNAVALAHVDCDSYRATRFLLPELLDRHLSSGGLLACEDYGHPALLGCRAAIEECLQGRHQLFRFFSQFSGVLVVRKP